MSDNYHSTLNKEMLNNRNSVTSDIMYNLKASSVSARSYRCSVPSSNSSLFKGGQNIIMYIPARRSWFLDNQQTYFKLTVKNNDTVSMTLDGSAMCFINRIDIYSGSNLIESIQQYNVLASMIIDTNLNVSNRIGHSSMYGTDVEGTRKGAVIAAGKLLSFCIPLISGVVGTLSETMLNLNLEDDIRVGIVLENNNIAVCYATAPTVNRWEIVNAELQCQIIELGDEGMQIVNSTMNSNGPIYLHTTAYKHFTSTLPAGGGGGTFSTPVPIRSANLKSI